MIRSSARKVLVTTPIFYANADPHIGHLTSAVYADILNRWNLFSKRESFMLTGMDEHGVKIQQAAALSGMNPKQKVDNEALKFKELFDTAGIAYSRFIRTTDADHAANVQDIWRTLMDNGYIYKGKHSGWYCVQDECFYGEQEVHDIMNSFGFQKVAKESGRSVEWIQEDNYMFALSGFKERIKQWLNSNPDLIYPKERRADVFRLLDSDSFGDVSVSRPKARQFWGIPVPHDENHTVYVWFDALLNYLTASTALSKDGHLSMNHVIGKDILRFHTILWPAVLMAADIPLPERIIIHSHWTVNNMKMSKSIGNVFHPDALIRKYGQDAVRYFIARDAGLKEDSDYSEDLLRMRYQVELADRLGNLLSRCFGRALNKKAAMPSFTKDILGDLDTEMINNINSVSSRVQKEIERGDICEAFEPVVQLINQTNKYLQINEPWKLVKSKDENDLQKANNVLYISLEALRVSGLLLQPVMPSSMDKLLNKLAISPEHRYIDNAVFNDKAERKMDSSPLILFQRLKIE